MTTQILTFNNETFNVISKIDEGASKIVWLVFDKQSNSLKALAQFRILADYNDEEASYSEDEIQDQIEQVYQHAIREFEITNRLRDCQNVIHIEKLYSKNKRIYFLMPHFTCGNLWNVINKYEISFKTKIQISIDIIKGLKKCHKRNIVLCDIKPANILINELFRATLIDFGEAQITDDPADFDRDAQSLFTSVFLYLFKTCDIVLSSLESFKPKPSEAITHNALIFFRSLLKTF